MRLSASRLSPTPITPMTTVAFLPGSFDPITNGHVGLLRAALRIADRAVLAIGINAAKSPLFSVEDRVTMLREVIAGLEPGERDRVQVIHFEGLLIDAARAQKATVLVRGLRDGSDFDSEMHMAAMNAELDPLLQTVFIPAAPMDRHISATLVRQIAEMKGDLSRFVPPVVARRLKSRL
jgi:pantetheine-phosphate adenylyltransferase